MRKIIFSIFLTCSLLQPVFAIDCNFFTWSNLHSNDNKAIKKILTTQVKSANKTDFERFISTYDPSYRNSDGFNLDIFSALIKDIWETY